MSKQSLPESGSARIEDDGWGDKLVTLSVTVAVAHYIEDPEQTARNLLQQRLEPSRGTIYNWGGRFAIVTHIEGEVEA